MKALVTGITGQDGSYLAELLLDKGYEVFGLVRRTSTGNTVRIAHLLDRVHLVNGDVLDALSLVEAIRVAAPDEVYHLAAQSFVGASWSQPAATAEVIAIGTGHLLEATRRHAPGARFYQASSSEMFGLAEHAPQDEHTPLHPRSPYGIAKVHAHHLAVHHREAFGLHVSCGIAFNHESPRRGEEFVTKKIARAAARIARGQQRELVLGNLEARRDWGWAPDYVEAMWRMLQQPEPGDYVLATGETHAVRDFVRLAFERVGLDPEDHVRVDPDLRRPTDIRELRGDASRARRILGWSPTVAFAELVHRMVDAE